MIRPLESIITELRRPFTPEAVQFKIQAVKNKALIVSYIDARQVGERLNTVCPGQWSSAYREVEGGVECTITISATGAGGMSQHRADVGISEGGLGGKKAVYSDAFKRAAVHWGIGVPLYYTPRYYADKADLDTFNEKHYMSRKVEGDARKAYQKWLAAEGVTRFGAALDLGDSTTSQGDAEVAPEEAPPEPEPAGQTAPKAPTMPRAGKDPNDNVLRNAYRGYLDRCGNTDQAKKQFGLWLNANNLPSNLKDLDDAQHKLVFDFLQEGA
jgi:hypothetical protein